MKRTSVILSVLVLLLVLGGGAVWSWQRAARRDRESRAATPIAAAIKTPKPAASLSPNDARAPSVDAAASAADRLARADKIRRDYDEMTAKFSADYAASGATSPAGLNGYLRQLALLEREKHKDLAALLTPRELEEVEMRDTNAGQIVQRQLADTAATEEQRRDAFRIEKEFEDQFALVFDLSPAALAEREAMRQGVQQKIRDVLGDDLFGSWLRGEGPDFAATAAYVQQQGLSTSVALDLWRAKSDFLLARLQLKARTDLAPEQLAAAEQALAGQTIMRVTSLLGPVAVAGPAREVLTWLPRAK